MNDEDPCSDELSAAVEAFAQRGTVEPGLDVEGEALLQLRKACRILDGIRALRDIDRHYTLVVEESFAALERTVQFYVVDRGLAETPELMNHEDTFEYGVEAGVFSETTKVELVELWQNYRNGTYSARSVRLPSRPKRCWPTPSVYTTTSRNSPVGHTTVSADGRWTPNLSHPVRPGLCYTHTLDRYTGTCSTR